MCINYWILSALLCIQKQTKNEIIESPQKRDEWQREPCQLEAVSRTEVLLFSKCWNRMPRSRLQFSFAIRASLPINYANGHGDIFNNKVPPTNTKTPTATTTTTTTSHACRSIYWKHSHFEKLRIRNMRQFTKNLHTHITNYVVSKVVVQTSFYICDQLVDLQHSI